MTTGFSTMFSVSLHGLFRNRASTRYPGAYVGSGVASEPRRGRCGCPLPRQRIGPHYLIETTIMSYSPRRPRFQSALLQIVQLISQRRHTAPLSMDRAEFDKFADEYRAMQEDQGDMGELVVKIGRMVPPGSGGQRSLLEPLRTSARPGNRASSAPFTPHPTTYKETICRKRG
jgi:hypothetical protein